MQTANDLSSVSKSRWNVRRSSDQQWIRNGGVVAFGDISHGLVPVSWRCHEPETEQKQGSASIEDYDAALPGTLDHVGEPMFNISFASMASLRANAYIFGMIRWNHKYTAFKNRFRFLPLQRPGCRTLRLPR